MTELLLLNVFIIDGVARYFIILKYLSFPQVPRHLLSGIPEGNDVVDIVFALDRLSIQHFDKSVSSDPNEDEAFIELKVRK